MRRFAPHAVALVGVLFAFGWVADVGARSSTSPAGEALAAPGGTEGADQEPAAGLDRWLYNPRERAATGLEALEDERAEEAVRAFDTAVGLSRGSAAEEAWARFDAGAARLLTAREAERAVALLERAAEGAPPELAPDALYNLGNARLAAGDPAGAVDAYRQALRLAPALQPAKRNLEIAWKRLEAASSQNEVPREEPRDEQPEASQEDGGGVEDRTPPAGDEQEPPEPGSEQEAGDQGAQDEGEDGEDRTEDPGSTEGTAQTDDQETQNEAGSTPHRVPQAEPVPPPLSRFRDQPDMTAAQAASLLAAIDHLERSQRRLEAARRARLAGERTKEKDW